jgi:hypothetical protein
MGTLLLPIGVSDRDFHGRVEAINAHPPDLFENEKKLAILIKTHEYFGLNGPLIKDEHSSH